MGEPSRQCNQTYKVDDITGYMSKSCDASLVRNCCLSAATAAACTPAALCTHSAGRWMSASRRATMALLPLSVCRCVSSSSSGTCQVVVGFSTLRVLKYLCLD